MAMKSAVLANLLQSSADCDDFISSGINSDIGIYDEAIVEIDVIEVR